MTGSFVQRALQANLTLTKGTFDGKHNTVQLDGLRMEADIQKGGHPSKNKLRLKIHGMSQHDMEALTTLPAKAGKALAVHKNLLQLLAGDSGNMAVAFEGEITGAWVDFQSAPGLYFQIEALAGYYPAIAPAAARSYRGAAAVSSIMATLAAEMGYGFEDNGVTAQLHNPCLSGSAYQQAARVAAAAGIEFGIDDGTLFIAPRGRARRGTVPLITPETGLKGYPEFEKEGLKLVCLYHPGIKLGGLISVQGSLVRVANGTWRVHGLKHHLSCESPGGPWETRVSATWVGN